LFSVADLLLPISEHWKEALKNMGAPTGKLKVFRMGIDPRAYNFHMRSIDTARPINILTIGRLVPKKGYTDSLKAIALLGDSLDVTYTIIGSGPCETEVRTVIRELNLDDRVKMMGSVPPEKVGSYFDKADLFLLPSKTDAVSGDKEGVPVVLMEAMASGLPVVSTYHSGIPELVKDGETGWLVPESSPELIAKSILAIVHNSQEIARRSEFARSKILKDFDIANLVKQLNELCEQNG
jgi:colanic acid/amylovoran biosynthesis glycosyltransferase